jgi:hypothetical protein
MSKAGDIEISVASSGYPYWCQVRYQGSERFQLHHSELRDLRYAADKAMREVRTNMRTSITRDFYKAEEKEV